MRRLIFTLLLVLAAYVGYMYFFGQGEDKENAYLIVNETKDLGKAVGDFLSKQKDKYDNGEFDRLLDKLSRALANLKSDSSEKSDDVNDDLRDLQNELKQIDPNKLNEENRKALEKLIEDVEGELE